MSFPLGKFFEDLDNCPFDPKSDLPWEWLKEKQNFGENTKIKKDYVVTEGCVVIGEDVEIESFVYIRDSVIGDGVKIGSHTKIKNCIVFDEAKINNHVAALDSIIGLGTRLSSGLVTRNRLHTQEKIYVNIDGKRFYTGRDKFGAIIGDYSRVSCSFTPVGCLIGMYSLLDCYVSPRFVPPKTHINYNLESRSIEPVKLKRFDSEGKI